MSMVRRRLLQHGNQHNDESVTVLVGRVSRTAGTSSSALRRLQYVPAAGAMWCATSQRTAGRHRSSDGKTDVNTSVCTRPAHTSPALYAVSVRRRSLQAAVLPRLVRTISRAREDVGIQTEPAGFDKKGYISEHSSSWESFSELRGVTCYTGSDSVTYHPTQGNAPRHNPSQIYLPRRDGRLRLT